MWKKEKTKPLPPEALHWDTRECNLWFLSNGAFHPRNTLGEGRKPADGKDAKILPGGPEGPEGKKGRVSVVTPTMDSRHGFHETLWKCFEAQEWPDKELVIIETFIDAPSKFFMELAKSEPRLIYVKFQVQKGADWSIGLKRNIGNHVATGEFIAHFDDDDLYAPIYLKTMISQLEKQVVQAVTLSSWYIFDRQTDSWHYCDPIAWGLAKGYDMTNREVSEKVYGYGFSYVFRRKACLDTEFEDRNMGEDFAFIQLLQHRRGGNCIALFHDDFGICLHIQHGDNTSNSITLREVDVKEAQDLEVMELLPYLGKEQAGLVASVTPPSERKRVISLHMQEKSDIEVRCPVSATIEDFVVYTLKALGHVGEVPALDFLRVAPLGDAEEEDRDKAAIDVLGLDFLARMPEAEHNTRPDSPCGRQWRELIRQAQRPMRYSDRLSLRTTELWVRPHEVDSEEKPPIDEGEPEEFFIVFVTAQQATVKKFFATTGALRARVPKGADVGCFRWVLSPHLPPTAKVLAEVTPGQGLVTLQDKDPVPTDVTVTDFKGARGFYAHWTFRELRVAMRMIKEFWLLPENLGRLDTMEAEAKGDEKKHAAIICQVLARECYPPILRHFGLPDHEQVLQFTIDCLLDTDRDWESAHLWVETEVLMRNKQRMRASASSLISQHYHPQGLEAPDWVKQAMAAC
mmetsp:Transcript_131294/g.292929  ORF Transcript_131294/g.292929 Transcript_131294/m.292929 type:complete len:686 (+) Transcript_131294:1-2058(+)